MKGISKSLENTLEKIKSDEIDSLALIISTESIELQKEISHTLAEKILGSRPDSNPDFLTLRETKKNSIGIDEIKNLISRLKFKPYKSRRKVALVGNAEIMTLEAQSSFLKTLEDIPSQTIIILTTSNHTKLLPTILSRCQLFEISSKENEEKKFDPEKVLKMSLYEKFKIVSEIAAMKDIEERRGEVRSLIMSLVNHFEKELNQNPDAAKRLKLLQATMTAVSENVNLKLALENMFVNLE